MAVARIDWRDLPVAARSAVQACTGAVTAVEPVGTGLNSAVAVLLHTEAGRVFVKGLRSEDPGATAQCREAAINPHVRVVSPRLRWQVRAGGWHLLGFDHLQGRHADYAPGSADVPLVVDALDALGGIRDPGLPDDLVRRAEHRWAEFLQDAGFLAGPVLLHTDFNPLNVIVTGGGARLVDWAWPTLGAGWIDPACLVLRLMADGHDAASAESWVARTEAWRTAPPAAVDAFAVVLCRMWEQITNQDPAPWKTRMATVARHWVQHRAG